LETAFATVAREQAGALVVRNDPVFRDYADRLVALAARERMPAIFPWREVVEASGLLSYGTDFPNAFRLTGIYAGRILKGNKPADLPVEQGHNMELVLNLKTAKALGLTFPLTLLGRADAVIEIKRTSRCKIDWPPRAEMGQGEKTSDRAQSVGNAPDSCQS
jgi:ABC-type uncharacterized transport system substrate-binding protein